VVTVCYNSATTIRDTIESVLSQKHKNIECIVVDGGSTDETVAIVKAFGDKISKLIVEPDEGIYDAMNKGIKASTGELVGILNSDDIYYSVDSLSCIAKTFEHNRELEIVFGDIIYTRINEVNKIVRYYSSKYFKPWKLRFGWMPPHQATYVKREAYLRYGLYKIDYKIAADYEMFIRWLAIEKLAYRRINKIIVNMRMGGVSTSGLRSNLILNREIVRACKSNGIYTNIFLVLSKMPLKLLELINRPRESMSVPGAG